MPIFRLSRKHRQLALGATLTLCWSACGAETDWPVLRDVDLSTVPGSALDFSRLVAAGPAGRSGWAVPDPAGSVQFEQDRKPQRFLCASMVFNPDNGGIPAKTEARRLVQELVRTGYNLVRLHYIDAHLMTRRTKDFDFDPEQFDRLQYLMSELKSAGIYWMVDGLTSNNGAYGDVQPHRYAKRYTAKLDVLTSEAGFQHWAALVDRIWAVRNPYTGTVPLQDPAMLGMILVNEGGIAFMATAENGGRYVETLAPLFRNWLRTRYGDDASWQRGWGRDRADDESLEGRVNLPRDAQGSGPREKDFARFASELEQRGFQRMDAYVRGKGFKGLTTAFDSWGFYNADVSRSIVKTIDMHSYHTLPSQHVKPGSVMAQTSVHDTAGRYVRALSNARQWGKPLLVSEYGQPFWNKYRHESPALVPAVAAHQGWSALCQFAETPIQFDYKPSPYARRQAIYPFGIGADPIAHAGERLAAMLYLRGDVKPSTKRIRLHLTPDAAFGRRAGREQIPEAVSRMAFMAPIGLDFGPVQSRNPAGELSVDLTSGAPTLLNRAQDALTRSGWDLSDGGMTQLQSAGILDTKNRSKPERQLFETDTGQLTFDVPSRHILVATDRTAVAVVESGSATAGALEVTDANAPVLIAVSSLDDQPVERSRHLLVWVLTDAVNTGMRFSDAARTTLTAIGTFPARVQPVSALVRVRNEQAAKFKAWPLALTGTRRTEVPVEVTGKALQLRVDTLRLPDGPALFFELQAE